GRWRAPDRGLCRGRAAAGGRRRSGADARHPRDGQGRADFRGRRGRPARCHPRLRARRRRRDLDGGGLDQPRGRPHGRAGMTTKNYGRVGVLYGGHSGEREVSLQSGAGVHQALRSAGVDAHLFDTGRHSLAELAQAGFDRVFIALHGRHGEDGTLQGALELLGIPYTGSGTLASSLAMDKVMTKRIWEHHGLPTPGFVELRGEKDLDAAVERLSLPMIVKPPHEGSTLGVARIDDRSQLLDGYRMAARYDAVVMAEQFIRGRELTVALIGTGAQARALPVI